MGANFKESVIIPLSILKELEKKSNINVSQNMFEEIKNPNSDLNVVAKPSVSEHEKDILTTDTKKSKSIIRNKNIKPDLKLKIFNQERWKEKKRPLRTKYPIKYDIERIVSRMQIEDQPFVKSIIENYINKNQDSISWEKDFEIKVGKKIFPKSDIIKTFQFLMTKPSIEKNEKIPPGTIEFGNKLIELGVPQSWIKTKLTRNGGNNSNDEAAGINIQGATSKKEKSLTEYPKEKYPSYKLSIKNIDTPPQDTIEDSKEKHQSHISTNKNIDSTPPGKMNETDDGDEMYMSVSTPTIPLLPTGSTLIKGRKIPLTSTPFKSVDSLHQQDKEGLEQEREGLETNNSSVDTTPVTKRKRKSTRNESEWEYF